MSHSMQICQVNPKDKIYKLEKKCIMVNWCSFTLSMPRCRLCNYKLQIDVESGGSY